MTYPTDHPLWPAFLALAAQEGYPLAHPDDWTPWWECYLCGAESAAALFKAAATEA